MHLESSQAFGTICVLKILLRALQTIQCWHYTLLRCAFHMNHVNISAVRVIMITLRVYELTSGGGWVGGGVTPGPDGDQAS